MLDFSPFIKNDDMNNRNEDAGKLNKADKAKKAIITKAPEVVTYSSLVGQGYDEFTSFKGRYRVVKGGRASKKSKTAALWFIHNMMEHPDANLLVVRKTYNSLKNSCYAELKWAINRLDAEKEWHTKLAPLEMSYNKGGKIFFRGLGDAMRLTSLAAERGKLCWVWIEEAFELAREDDFNLIDEGIRGRVDGALFKQLTLTFNPWSERHWLKDRFFKGKNERFSDADTLAITTNYKGNEYLDESDIQLFERMQRENPKRYKVAGLGEWGLPEGLVYENWEAVQYDKRTLFRAIQHK
ncbi:MAG: PBSX family phage terminase large subunit, partial [Oscillospiraceae bacterium]|nr:PBSX family phage terminase large subunit [Oscillospiraceae bacterium]